MEKFVNIYADTVNSFRTAKEQHSVSNYIEIGLGLIRKLKPLIVELRRTAQNNEAYKTLQNDFAELLIALSVEYFNRCKSKGAGMEVIPLLSAANSLQTEDLQLKRIQNNVSALVAFEISCHKKIFATAGSSIITTIYSYLDEIIPFVVLAKGCYGSENDEYMHLSSAVVECAVNEVIEIINNDQDKLKETVPIKILLDVFDKDPQYIKRRYGKFSKDFDKSVMISGVYKELQYQGGPSIVSSILYPAPSKIGYERFCSKIKSSVDLRIEEDFYKLICDKLNYKRAAGGGNALVDYIVSEYGDPKRNNPKEKYGKKYPLGKYVVEIAEMDEEECFLDGNYEEYLKTYPKGRFVEQAKVNLEERKVDGFRTVEQLQQYIKDNPNSPFLDKANKKIQELLEKQRKAEEEKRKEEERMNRQRREIEKCQTVSAVIEYYKAEKGNKIDKKLCREKAFSLCEKLRDYELFLEQFDDDSNESKQARERINDIKRDRTQKCLFIFLVLMFLIYFVCEFF